MAEQVNRPEREAGGHALRPRPRIEGTETSQGEAEEGGLRIAIGGEPGEALDDPRPLSQPLQVLTHPNEGMHDVEVVHANQLAAARVEEDELPQGEELERAAEAGACPPRRLGYSPHPAMVARVEVHEPVALPERPPADHDSLGLVQSHGYDVRRNPNSRRARSSVRQFRRTPTASSRKTLTPKKRSRSSRAAVPIRLRVAPPLPMRMPFWESCSTKIRARM